MNHLNKWKISAYLAAIFLAGAVAGAFLGFKAGEHRMFLPPSADSMTAHACDELQTRLNLSPAQAQKIQPIVSNSISQFQTVVGADLSMVFSNFDARIALELTPEQQVKFRQFEQERQRFMNHSPQPAPAGSTNSAPAP